MTSDCPQCGKAVGVRNKYCSRRCAQLARRRPKSKVCEQCGTTFSKPINSGSAPWERRRFCSRACRNESFKRVVYFTCEGCGKQTKTLPSRVATRRFCADCNYKFAHRSRHLGTATRLGGDTRKRLITQNYYSNTCEICGFDRCYDLAHIVRPKKGGTMEAFNILTLCPNHHRLFDSKDLTAMEYAQIRDKVEAAQARLKERQA